MKVLFISFLACLWQQIIYADTTAKVWNSLSYTKTYNKYSYYLESQFRVRVQNDYYEQSLNLFGLTYQNTPFMSSSLGVTVVDNGRNGMVRGVDEFRTWQQLVHSFQENNYKYLLRSRFEQRKRNDSRIWNYRIRERLFISKEFQPSLFIVAYDEVFININQPHWLPTKTLDQNRLSIGLNQAASKALTLGVGYIYQIITSHPRQTGHIASFNMQYMD